MTQDNFDHHSELPDVICANFLQANEGPIYRRIVEAVREGVASGRLGVDQQLPTYQALAERLKVGVMTVRRAYECLEAEGIVVRKHGSGSYIAADALRSLETVGGRFFDSVVVVLGTGRVHPVDCKRDQLRAITEILAGVENGLHNRFQGLSYMDEATKPKMESLSGDSAVLIWQPHNRHTDPAMIDTLLRRNIPVVCIDGDPAQLPLPHVQPDYHQAPELACQHLLDSGYQQLGFIGNMGGPHPLGAKFFAFTNTLFHAELDFQVRHVANVCSAPGLAYAAASRMVAAGNLPEAFFVDTAWKALEVMAALKDAGVRVPEDVGVIAHDDLPEAASSDPPLTTVRMPYREMGRRAAQLCIEHTDEPSTPQVISLPSELILRSSTAIRATATR